MDYEPRPIDTSKTELSTELTSLVEALAKHNHDIWAIGRIEEGWTWGPERDDDAKTHPDLVPYEELSESEKAYDRNAAIATLRAVQALGGDVLPPSETCERRQDAEERAEALRRISEVENLRTATTIWNEHDPETWAPDARLYRNLASRLLDLSAPLVAFDVIQEGLEHEKGDLRLLELKGLALARAGYAPAACAVLEQLREAGHEGDETLGMLGRVYKDLALGAADEATRKAWLQKSHDTYLQAYRQSDGDIWTGVNTATLALLLGRDDDAVRHARDVRARCMENLAALGEEDDPYWILATLGEAAVVLGEPAEAARWYERAVEAGKRNLGRINSTRGHVRLLLECRPEGRAAIEACFAQPQVVVFAGHMIDQEGRSVPRFPAGLEACVRAEIGGHLDAIGSGIAYASAACGSDLIFLEEAQKREWDTYVVLPYARADFIRDSVDLVPGGDWRGRFEKVLSSVTGETVVSPQRMRWGSASYEYANTVLLGLASLRARIHDTALLGLAVWDKLPGDGSGGTSWIVDLWREKRYEHVVIDLAALLAAHVVGDTECADEKDRLPARPPEPPPPPDPDSFDTEIKALLFADARHFSSLNEWQVPTFVRVVMGLVGDLTRTSSAKPIVKNTWGDGLYLVFDHVRDAGLFALELAKQIRDLDQQKHGLPETLVFRIGLHAGPVYTFEDPVTGQRTCGGTHVSRAARIEPIVPPGEVYASEYFAALVEFEGVEDFDCTYAGIATLAKKYGPMVVHHVRPRST